MQLMKHAVRWLVLALALGYAPSADAATIAFDFAGFTSGQWAGSLDFASQGVWLTVTAATTAGVPGMVQTRAGRGLGVASDQDCTFRLICHGLEGQIDTVGPDDLALFHFDIPVQILSLSFTQTNGHDQFDLLVDGVLQLHAAAQPVVAVGTAFATDFGLGASVFDRTLCRMSRAKNPRSICRTYSWDSAFTLSGMTIEAFPMEVNAAAIIPLPASGLLLLAGPIGLVLCTRKRRRATWGASALSGGVRPA